MECTRLKMGTLELRVDICTGPSVLVPIQFCCPDEIIARSIKIIQGREVRTVQYFFEGVLDKDSTLGSFRWKKFTCTAMFGSV